MVIDMLTCVCAIWYEYQSIFTEYGVLWFCWSDFIPRFLGSLALFVIVVAKNPPHSTNRKHAPANMSHRGGDTADIDVEQVENGQ